MMLKILNASSQQHFVQLLIQRVKESEWSNVPKNGHKASLYYFDLSGQKQIKIPPKDKGDYQPRFIFHQESKLDKKKDTDIVGDLWIWGSKRGACKDLDSNDDIHHSG
jgi:hypothetical protein